MLVTVPPLNTPNGNESTMEEIWITAVALGFVGFMVLRARRVRQKMLRVWRTFADMSGLHFDEGSMTRGSQITGEVEGRAIRIAVVTRGSGKNKTVYTDFSAQITGEVPQGLQLTREHFFSGLGKLFGSQDIRTGFEELDRIAMIKGVSTDAVIAYFQNDLIRQAAIDHLRSSPLARIEGKNVLIAHHGIVDDLTVLQQATERLVQVARSLSLSDGRRQ